MNYPIQPFIFEFSKDASKGISTRDIQPPSAIHTDLQVIDRYLATNGPFIDDSSKKPINPCIEKKSCSISDINPVFLDPNFSLKSPRYFSSVFPPGCLSQKMFNEKLISQMETVQSLLFESSENQTVEFFASFSSIHEMHNQLSSLVPQISQVKSDLDAVMSMSSVPSRIKTLIRKKERLTEIIALLDKASSVVSANSIAINLAESYKFDSALAIIDESMETLRTDLIRVSSMRKQMSTLKATHDSIVRKVQEALFQFLTGSIQIDPKQIVVILSNKGILQSTIDEASDVVARYNSSAVSRMINEAMEQNGHGGTKITSLSIKQFVDVLNTAFPNIRTRILVRTTENVARISSIIDQDISNASVISQKTADCVFKEITSIVTTHPLSSVTLADFGELFEAMLSFGRGVEKFGIDQSLFKSSLSSLTRAFVTPFHCEQSKRISQTLLVEKWVKCEPKQVHFDILYKLTSNKCTEILEIDHDQFGSTQSMLVLLEITWNYQQAARTLQISATDITSNLAETLKSYNSLAYELLLKGTAMQTAGMKSISTKNLALSAATLEFFIKLIPYLKGRMEGMGARAQVVKNQLDEVTKGYREHHTQVMNKIKDIMTMQINKHISAYKGDTDTEKLINGFTNEIITIHRVSSSCLPKRCVDELVNHTLKVASASLEKIDVPKPSMDSANQRLSEINLSFH